MSSYITPTNLQSHGGSSMPSVAQLSAVQSRLSSTSSASGFLVTTEAPLLGQIEALLKTLNDPVQRDDLKLKALQEVSECFELLTAAPAYPALMENLLRVFIKLLQETTPQFIGENNTQQLRKLILELIHRMPSNDYTKVYAKPIIAMLFKLIETENEENALACLRIIIELEKQCRPPFMPEVQQFLTFVKSMYGDLPLHVNRIFEPHSPLHVAEIHHFDVESALQNAYTISHIQTQQKLSDGGSVVYTLLPRSRQSLKVLAELPIIAVLLYQVYKQNVQHDIADFIPLVLNTIVLTPSPQHRSDQRFNRDILIDFMAAQIKALSFVAFLGRVYQDAVNSQASSLVKGIITLLATCPHEIAHLRKELLVATRHILGTELRMKFIPYINQLFEENLLIGSGWTANENLRPLAYSTLADLVHHVRQQLPLQSLTGAVFLFSRCAHDSTISCGIQTMACKLLLNLVESISKQQESGVARELLLFMLDVFVRKFKVVALEYLPQMFEKCEKRRYEPGSSGAMANSEVASTPSRQSIVLSTAETPTVEVKATPVQDVFSDTEPKETEADNKQLAAMVQQNSEKEEKLVFGTQQSNAVPSLADARALVKTLVCGVKTITWGIGAGRVSGTDANFSQPRHLQPRDTAQFLRLLKYGLQSLDVYMITPTSGMSVWQKRQHTSTVQSKDEKDVIDHFAGLFALLNIQTFKEIFSTNIEFLVERISENLALQAVPNAFLANSATSPAFATILIDFLIKRLAIMGSHEEQSNLCLKLFKIVFGSVSLFAAENEQMLKPHLHRLVTSSLEMSLTAKEPFNYFLLLRGLFRSIGGGSHDLLYQEFLPLLPGLLKNLNNLQNGYHRQQMKELLVELCLTVPVRLSSLVPHLPMLMEPLVSALSGSSALVLQGLRTLELCIDNLQPEFLHEHMAPVRPQMLQALAKILNTPGNDQAAVAAWKTIGKLGGLNRKMLTDVQQLNHSQRGTSGPVLPLTYVENSSILELPIANAIQHASSLLKQSTVDLNVRIRCFRMIRAFIVSLIPQPEASLTEIGESWLYARFQDAEPSAVDSLYRCREAASRTCCVDAVTAILHAATAKDSRQEALPFVNALVRYLSFLALCEQTGVQALKEQCYYKVTHMDTGIVSEAIVNVMADEDKELCKAGILAMTLVLDTASSFLCSIEKAAELPMMREICKSVVRLCYEPAWYEKLGGCSGIKYMLEHFPLRWVAKMAGFLADALVYVIIDSMGQIANGALDMAKLNLELLVKKLCKLETIEERDGAIFVVVKALIPCLTSWSGFAREQAQTLLETIADAVGKVPTVQLVLPHMKDNLLSFLGIANGTMTDLTIYCRIGVLSAFTYLVNDQLPSTKFDPCGEPERRVFTELVNILDGDKAIALAVPGYEKEAEMSLIRLKMHAASAILAWKDVREFRERTFMSLFKTLTSDVVELQESSYECLQKFVASSIPETDMLHTAMRPLLLLLSDFKSLTLKVAKKLLYLTKLFPTTFNEKLCDQLLAHLKKWLDVAAASPPPKIMQQFVNPEMETCAVIVEIFHHIPAASPRFVEALVPVLCKAEATMNIEAGSPWRHSLLKFLVRYPAQTAEFFLAECNLKEDYISSAFLWILKQDCSKQFRDVLQNNPHLLLNLLSSHGSSREVCLMPQEKLECLILRLIRVLASRDRTWLPKHPQLVDALRTLWNNPEFRGRYAEESCDTQRLKAPKSVVRCLFYYFQADTNDIGLLYDILSCFIEKFSSEFEWLKKFLEKEVAVNFTIEWKRLAFMRFLTLYGNPNVDVRIKIKILQHVIIPSVHRSLEKGEADQLIGSSPAPEIDSDDNLIAMFLAKVIDTIDTQRLSALPDVLLISLYQLTCLFVEYAAPHIHDTNSKKQGARLRKVMLFGWPCLQQNNSLDPSARYYGHLLIAHIIEKFAINRKIVLQVFHSLLKAHGQEARHVVRQALNILAPSVPQRMEDGHAQLAQFAKKLIVEEGHSTPQLIHILQLVTRHYKLFYPVRHQLLPHLVNAIQKLGTLENKKLAVDVCETIIRWELCCLKKDEADPNDSTDDLMQATTSKTEVPAEEVTKRVDKPIVETTLNFLFRLACYVPEQSAAAQSAAGGAASMEALSKRCLQLIKVALKPDMWGLKAGLKLQWLEKALANAVNDQNPNPTLACTCLDVLSYMITVLPSTQLLSTIRPIQRGIVFCLGCQNKQVLKSLYNFLTKLLGALYSETTSLGGVDSLEVLAQSLQKTLADAFSNYEKVPALGLNGIYGATTLLKAVCSVDPAYIDRVLVPASQSISLSPLMKALQKLAREHTVTANSDMISSSADLLYLCLDLVRPRVEAMNGELRKQYLQNVLVVLLDKSNTSKVISSVIKHLSDWMKLPANSIPSLRERQHLLLKLSQTVEKKFANDAEIMKSFLDLVYFAYKNDQWRTTELPQKLESAFLLGLRQSDAEVRSRFFEIFDGSIRKHPFDRLFYIMCTQNWEPLQQHYWVKQCIELLLAVVHRQSPLSFRNAPCFASIAADDQQSSSGGDSWTVVKAEPMEGQQPAASGTDSQEVIDFDSGSLAAWSSSNGNGQLRNMWRKQIQFLQSIDPVSVGEFLAILIELCHNSTELAENTWIHLLRNTVSLLDDSQRQNLSNEIIPFLCSGTHLVQKHCTPSVLRSFVEAFSGCSPAIFIKPSLLQYLGQTHGIWHRAILLLESSLDSLPSSVSLDSIDDPASAEKLEIYDGLCELYARLNEQDLWAAVWFQRACFPDTKVALRYEQVGLFDSAAEAFEKAMMREQVELSDTMMNLNIFQEMRVWEQHWAKCVQELNQWECLKDLASAKGSQEPFLLLECAWRLPNWGLMKEALVQVESSCPKELAWKAALYQGYYAVGCSEEHHTNNVERIIEQANQLMIKEWRMLPKIMSQSHAPLLQAAQQVVELHEAAKLLNTVQSIHPSRPPDIHEIKSVVKTWRNRVPAVFDSLTHWGHVFSWRLHHYKTLVNTLESDSHQAQSSLLGIHASAQCLIQFAKTARRRGLLQLAVDTLNRLHTIPNLPVIDGFQKLREQVKCCLRASSNNAKNIDGHQATPQEGLDIIENSNISYFNKETSADLYALKGALLSHMNRWEEATKAFSTSLQLNDGSCRAWGAWGEHLEQMYFREKDTNFASQAVVCCLQAARLVPEVKARKYLVRVFWLLKFDTDGTISADSLSKFPLSTPPLNWVFWLPQLINLLKDSDNSVVTDILINIGKAFPEAVLLAIVPYLGADGTADYGEDENNWRAKLQRILSAVSDAHPCVSASIYKIIREMMEKFPRHWSEKALSQLRMVLRRCYRQAFENRNDVQGTCLPSSAVECIGRVRNILNESDDLAVGLGDVFGAEFDPNVAGTRRLWSVVGKRGSGLIKWCETLESRISHVPTVHMLPEKSHYLASFCAKIALLDMFGETLTPRMSQYCVKIAKFLPRVETVHRGDIIARRFWIRGSNGKKYPFLLIPTEDLFHVNAQQRLLQLFRILNVFLAKNKEVASRLLQFDIPSLIPISPDYILISDKESNVTLLDFLKNHCKTKEVTVDDLVARYYEKLLVHQSRNSPLSQQVLLSVVKDIGLSVPKSALTNQISALYPEATDYYAFRKQICLHVSVLNACEYLFHLSPVGPHEWIMAKDTGFTHVEFYSPESKAKLASEYAGRPVPFRLTPALVDFFGVTINGYMAPAMTALGRCFQQQQFQHWLRVLLWDDDQKAGNDCLNRVERLIMNNTKATVMFSSRLQALSQTENVGGRSHTLISSACSLENLCRMDPSWHPWF